LDFELKPDLQPGKLQHFKITIKAGKNLIPCDPNGKSDPYCCFGFVYDNTKNIFHTGGYQTKPKRKTLNPKWSEKHNNVATFHFMRMPISIFLILIKDDDLIGSDDMGQVQFRLNDLPGSMGTLDFPVEKGNVKKTHKEGYGALTIEWELRNDGCRACCQTSSLTDRKLSLRTTDSDKSPKKTKNLEISSPKKGSKNSLDVSPKKSNGSIRSEGSTDSIKDSKK